MLYIMLKRKKTSFSFGQYVTAGAVATGRPLRSAADATALTIAAATATAVTIDKTVARDIAAALLKIRLLRKIYHSGRNSLLKILIQKSGSLLPPPLPSIQEGRLGGFL